MVCYNTKIFLCKKGKKKRCTFEFVTNIVTFMIDSSLTRAGAIHIYMVIGDSAIAL